MSEFLWKKKEEDPGDRPEIVKKVLVLYTGGTIGMKWMKEKGLVLYQLLGLVTKAITIGIVPLVAIINETFCSL